MTQPEGKGPLGRFRSRWKDYNMDFEEVGWGLGRDLYG
jgi:hypothetical protein